MKRRRSQVVATFVFALGAGITLARGADLKLIGGGSFKSGKDFLAECDAAEPPGTCLGYLAGVSDLLNTTYAYRCACLAETCPPADMTLGQLHAVVVKWIKAHPDQLDGTASSLIVAAMKAAYPCASTPAKPGQ